MFHDADVVDDTPGQYYDLQSLKSRKSRLSISIFKCHLYATIKATPLLSQAFVSSNCFLLNYGKCPKISHTMFFDKLAYANSVDPDQTAHSGAV